MRKAEIVRISELTPRLCFSENTWWRPKSELYGSTQVRVGLNTPLITLTRVAYNIKKVKDA